MVEWVDLVETDSRTRVQFLVSTFPRLARPQAHEDPRHIWAVLGHLHSPLCPMVDTARLLERHQVERTAPSMAEAGGPRWTRSSSSSSNSMVASTRARARAMVDRDGVEAEQVVGEDGRTRGEEGGAFLSPVHVQYSTVQYTSRNPS